MTKPHELLFDTGCLFDIYHGRERIKPYFDAILTETRTAYLSVITEAEIWRGLRVGEIARHEALLQQFTVLPLRSDAARLAGSWMQQYQSIGLGWMDALISATAKTANIPILTRDKRLVTLLSTYVKFESYQ